MSNYLRANHAVQGGRIGSPEIKTAQTVAIEPVFFVELLPGYLLTANDEIEIAIGAEALAQWNIIKRDYASAESLPGSQVYCLTAAQLKAIRARAQDARKQAQNARSAAQQHTSGNSDGCGADCRHVSVFWRLPQRSDGACRTGRRPRRASAALAELRTVMK